MLLSEQDIIKKRWINGNITKLGISNDNKKYKVEIICNNVVYKRELESDYLPKLYYLVFCKSYLEEKNI